MLITIIITLLTFAGAVCGIWGIGESEGICKYDYTEDTNNEQL